MINSKLGSIQNEFYERPIILCPKIPNIYIYTYIYNFSKNKDSFALFGDLPRKIISKLSVHED